MKEDVIVLTTGFGGSSVLTGLLANAGYWPGDQTAKVAYETYENGRLIELNRLILAESGQDWEDRGDAVHPDLEAVAAIRGKLDPEPFTSFVQECRRNRPFIWKDPRLVYTMEVWADFLDLDDIRFLVADRDARQAWTGQVLRGGAYVPFGRLKAAMDHSVETSLAFCASRGAEAVRVSFEDLIVNTDETLKRINAHVGLGLSAADLTAVYSGRLGSKRWSDWDDLKARIKSVWLQRPF
jgi:hypothetical protein